MLTLESLIDFALRSPEYHREALMQRPLRPLQISIVRAIENHIHNHQGRPLCIMTARQTAKNECKGTGQERWLIKNARRKDQPQWIGAAPTIDSCLTSMERLELLLSLDPLAHAANDRPLWQCRRGGTLDTRLGAARVRFLSEDTFSKGKTAHVLDVDEAQDFDQAVYEKIFRPMTADTDGATIFSGVASDGDSMIEQAMKRNEELGFPEKNIVLPAPLWIEYRPQYRSHYEAVVRDKGGEDHPVIQTQYLLKSVASLGGFLSQSEINSLWDSDIEYEERPVAGAYYVITYDVGGDDDLERVSEDVRVEKPWQDSTAILFWRVFWDKKVARFPMIRLVHVEWWTGQGMDRQIKDAEGLAWAWRPRDGVGDVLGIGAQLGRAMKQYIPRFVEYRATADSVTQDLWEFMSMVKTGALKFWKRRYGNPLDDEVNRQLEKTRYEIASHRNWQLKKWGERDAHIDILKAATFIRHALKTPFGYTAIQVR